MLNHHFLVNNQIMEWVFYVNILCYTPSYKSFQTRALLDCNFGYNIVTSNFCLKIPASMVNRYRMRLITQVLVFFRLSPIALFQSRRTRKAEANNS